MRAAQELQEISEGIVYDLDDYAAADCRGCTGCSQCCRGTGDSVLLDPLDVDRLCRYLNKPPALLFDSDLILLDMDGLLVPCLSMEDEDQSCIYLNGDRCSVYPARPQICRLFPLGRYFGEGKVEYFLQIYECPLENRRKVRVRDWIDTPDPKKYEQFALDWHGFLREVRKALKGPWSQERIWNFNLSLLRLFYFEPYSSERDFYDQFYERLLKGREELSGFIKGGRP